MGRDGEKGVPIRTTACTKVLSCHTASSGTFRELESMKGRVVKVRLGSRQGLDQGGEGAWPFSEQWGASDG